MQISALRRVLDEGRSGSSCIQTVAARGYRLGVPVTRVERGNRATEATFAASPGPDAACRPAATVNDDEAPSSEAVADLPPAGTSAATARLPHLGRTPMSAIIAAAVVAAFVTWWVWSAPSLPTASAPAAVSAPQPIPPRLSIVVLPFANLSGDPDQQYLADGITEDLTTDLSRFPNTLVIARNTAFTYKSKPADATQIGRELGVRYLIEGSVRRSADQVQVNVQLIDAESGVHLWADRFETDRRNLAEAQDAITGRLAKTLSVELLGSASRRIEQERRADPDARDLPMRAAARALRGPGSPAVYQEVRRLFEQALEKDPDFVDAKVGIAMTLVSGVAGGWSPSVKEDEAQAEPILLAAIEQDPNNQTAHQVLGILRRVQYRLGEAKIELEIAISLDPNSHLPIATSA